jgi:hypothetical protein
MPIIGTRTKVPIITSAQSPAGSPTSTARCRLTRASHTVEFVTTFGIAERASRISSTVPVWA